MTVITEKTLIKNIDKGKKITPREGFGKGLLAAAKKDIRIVVLTADVMESTRCQYFKKIFPNRFIEVGVAEQNMMGIAAGLAISGKIPFVVSYAVFSPGRNWEQLRTSVCYSKANVKIIGSHAGITVGADGATHQGLEDIAITRCLPNLTVIVPGDAKETQKATMAIAQHQGPVYMRVARASSPIVTTDKTSFKIGQAEIFKTGQDVTIVVCGPIIYQVLKVAQQLQKEKISVEVINNHTIKPLDISTIIKSVKKTKCLVTVEDHQMMGGMGSAVIEALSQQLPVPTEMIGIQDRFGESGSADNLMKKYHLTTEDIVRKTKKVLKKK